MLKKWYLSGKGALSEFIHNDIDEISDKEFFDAFEKNFDNLISSWIMKEEVKEFDVDEDIVVTREAYNDYTAITSKIFSGLLANKWRSRELKDIENIESDLDDLPSEVVYDGEQVYSQQAVASEYLKDTLVTWGEGNSGKNGECSICEKEDRVVPVKQYIYPFTIVRDKFKNLRPDGTENINVCKKCASILFSAYSNVIFNLNDDYLNLIFMYSEDMDDFRIFKNRVMRTSIEVKYNTNLEGINNYAGVKRPYDFLFVTLNEFSKKPELSGELEDIPFGDIGFVISGANVSGDKSIFSDVDYLDSSSKIWDLFNGWRENYEETPRAFFHSMVPNIDNEDLIINRNRFLEKMLVQKKIGYKSLEKATFANISENQGVLSFSNQIVRTFLEVFEKMDEKEIFDQVSKKGYSFGREISEIESNPNKSKGHLYQLRRSRDLGAFLDNINSIQTSLGINFNQKVFLENKDEFDKLKPIFLISMANAIFGGKNDE